MNEELYKALVEEGLAPEAAEKIAKAHPQQAPTADDTPTDIDTDKLTKAMQELTDTMHKGGTENEDTEALTKAINEAENIVEAVSAGADRIVQDFRDQNDAISKGLLAIGETVRQLAEHQRQNTEGLQKALAGVQNELGVPQTPQSIASAEDIVPAPGDGNPEKNERSIVKAKALDELKTSEDGIRKGELSRAVALLEAGKDPADVKEQFRL